MSETIFYSRTRLCRCVYIIGVSLTALLSGCHTVPIRPERQIAVPPGLTQAHVQLAVLAAILNQPKGGVPIAAAIADAALRAGLPGYTGVSVSGGRHPWYYEGEEGDTLIAGFQSRERYLQVRCRCTATSVGLTIAMSEGFRQSSTRIHENAYVYTEQLVARIRRSLGEVARLATHANTVTPDFYGPH